MPGHVILKPPGRGFHISYNPLRISAMMRRAGVKIGVGRHAPAEIPETALCRYGRDRDIEDMKIYILKGDYRSKYETAVKGGWSACYWDVYIKNGGHHEGQED